MQIHFFNKPVLSNYAFGDAFSLTNYPQNTTQKTDEVFAGIYKDHSINQASKTLTQKRATHLGNTLLVLQNWVAKQFFRVTNLLEAEDSLFMLAQSDAVFRYYASYHQVVAQSFRTLANDLKSEISSKEFHEKVLSFWQLSQKEGILSPLAFLGGIEKLTRVISKMNLSQDYRIVLDNVREQLKPATPKLIIKDIVYFIILLSGGQIGGNDLLNRLHVYKDMIEGNHFSAFLQHFQDFIKEHQLEEINHEKLITSRIPNHDYRELISTVQSILVGAENAKVDLEQGYSFNEIIRETSNGLKQGFKKMQTHPYLTLALVALFFGKSSHVYAQSAQEDENKENKILTDTSGDINGDGEFDASVHWRRYVIFDSQEPFPVHSDLEELDGSNGLKIKYYDHSDGSTIRENDEAPDNSKTLKNEIK